MNNIERAITHLHVLVTSSHNAGWQANRDAWAVIRAALAHPHPAGDDWTPTSANINALPEKVRAFIHDLQTNCDPSGTVQENVLLREQTLQLNAMIERLKREAAPTGEQAGEVVDEDLIATWATSVGAEVDGGDAPDHGSNYPGYGATITFDSAQLAAFVRLAYSTRRDNSTCEPVFVHGLLLVKNGSGFWLHHSNGVDYNGPFQTREEAAEIATLTQPRPVGVPDGEVVAVLDRALGDVMHAQCAMAKGKPCDYLESDPKEISATISKLATQPRSMHVPDGPLTGKYADVLVPFVSLMERELHANAGKGDRPGWLSMSPATAVLEVHHHVAKLQKAVLNGDVPGVREYAADVANMSMMAVDVCGALIDAAPAPGKERG